jgi:hypothetical protein
MISYKPHILGTCHLLFCNIMDVNVILFSNEKAFRYIAVLVSSGLVLGIGPTTWNIQVLILKF